MANIPAPLLHAISNPGGGMLSIVIGAGCSFEAPTSIPLAGDLANTAYDSLVRDGVIAAGACNPRDLPGLASVVFGQSNSQAELVSRLPIDRMRMAKANLGYKCLVALMAERAVSNVLSLNFDLAVQSAASELGIVIHSITQPGGAVPNTPTLVYLHGCATSGAEDLILRTAVMDDQWKANWHQVIANQILAAPNVLFVGLGSAAPVLSETVAFISGAVGAKAYFQADIGDHNSNHLAQQLGLEAARYVKGGWSEVMQDLTRRLAVEQRASLVSIGRTTLDANGHSKAEQDLFERQAQTLSTLELLGLGRVRAAARLSGDSIYARHTTDDDAWLAAPLLALGKLAENAGFLALPTPIGTWSLRKGGLHRETVMLVTGRGAMRTAALEPAIRRACDELLKTLGAQPGLIIVGGTTDVAPQFDAAAGGTDIVDGGYAPEGDIVFGSSPPHIVSCGDDISLGRAGEWLNAA